MHVRLRSIASKDGSLALMAKGQANGIPRAQISQRNLSRSVPTKHPEAMRVRAKHVPVSVTLQLRRGAVIVPGEAGMPASVTTSGTKLTLHDHTITLSLQKVMNDVETNEAVVATIRTDVVRKVRGAKELEELREHQLVDEGSCIYFAPNSQRYALEALHPGNLQLFVDTASRRGKAGKSLQIAFAQRADDKTFFLCDQDDPSLVFTPSKASVMSQKRKVSASTRPVRRNRKVSKKEGMTHTLIAAGV